MPNFTIESSGQFNIPGVTIEQTLISEYDPYSGIDLTDIYSCSHVEIMTLTSAAIGEQEFCMDAFAATGPKWFGGTGEIGRCKNFGRVNFRTMGKLPNSSQGSALGYANWITAGAEEPFEHSIYGTLGPNFWGIPGVDDDNSTENSYTQYTAQIQFSTANFNFTNHSPNYPSGNYLTLSDADQNAAELRLYWSAKDNDFTDNYNETDGEQFKFAHFPDDWAGFYMDDGLGGDLQLKMSSDYGYVSFLKHIHKDRIYRILIRHIEENGTSRYDSGYQSAAGKEANGESWKTDSDISTRNGLKTNCSYIEGTYIDPPLEDDVVITSDGDGRYYRTDGLINGLPETPYYSSTDAYTVEDNIDYIRTIDCDTIIDRELKTFNRMRAVCKDGSYVEMANNGSGLNLSLIPEENNTITQEYTSPEEAIFERTYYNYSDDSNSEDFSVTDNWDNGDLGYGEIFSLEVIKIEMTGDFSGLEYDEYLNITIGDAYWPNMTTGYQDNNWHTVYQVANNQSGTFINSFSQNLIPYTLYASPSVNDAGGSISFAVRVTFKPTFSDIITSTEASVFQYFSGIDACNSITEQNTDLYFSSDSDDRPSLGVFSTKDNNISQDNFTEDLNDSIFNQVLKINLLSNGDGRYTKENEYYTTSLGVDSYKPQGDWGYISFDGVGVNITELGYTPGGGSYNLNDNGQNTGLNNYPNNTYQKMFISHPQYQEIPTRDLVYGYTGFYPYILATEETTEYAEEAFGTLDIDLGWAKWVKSNNCYSFGKCLKFEASNRWEDIKETNGANFSSALNNQIGDIFKFTNEHSYRTLNQFQQIYFQNKSSGLNPYSSLKVSFWMMTDSTDEYYDESNLPVVESSITRGGLPNKNNQSYDLKTQYSTIGGMADFFLPGNAPERPIFQILWGTPTPQGDAELGTLYVADGESRYQMSLPYYQTAEIEDAENLIADGTNATWTYYNPPGEGNANVENEIAPLDEFNVCSFTYGDIIIDDVLNWANSNYVHNASGLYELYQQSTWDIADPRRLDISLSGYPYWSAEDEDDSPKPFRFTTTDSNNLGKYYKNPRNRDWSLYESETALRDENLEFGFASILDARPKILGPNAPSVIGKNYAATPLGCAQFVAEIVLPSLNPLEDGDRTGYYAGVGSEGGMPATIAEMSELLNKSLIPRQDGAGGLGDRTEVNQIILSEPESTSIKIIGHPSPPAASTYSDFDIKFERYTISSYLIDDVQMFQNVNSFYNQDYIDAGAAYNSITSDNQYKTSPFGSTNRFVNSKPNVWEKMEYTFNLANQHIYQEKDTKNLYFLIQAGGSFPSTSFNDNSETPSLLNLQKFRGTVYLDNLKVEESYDFQPDCDVRKKKGPNEYGKGDLTKYYDPLIDLEEYNDTIAPLEVQFYFYPRYYYNKPFDKDTAIIYNDFRYGMFYIYNVDWGDGTPIEYSSNPFKINENTSVYHTYETSGIFEVTGTMLRMKPDGEYNELGVIHNKRFVLRINVSEGLDEDFTYFGSEGFSFVPYKNTLPIIGGYSNQSIYYKSTKRQLGILENNQSVETSFKGVGDRLKTEIALNKMDSSYSGNFQLLNAFKKTRYFPKSGDYFLQPWIGAGTPPSENTITWPQSSIAIDENLPTKIITIFNDGTLSATRLPSGGWVGSLVSQGLIEGNVYTILISGSEPFNWDLLNTINDDLEIINNGIETNSDELGKSIGDTDITNVKYFNTGSINMWNMLGFDDEEANNPGSSIYWKKIIPQDYSIYNREGLGGDYISSESQQDWLGDYYYPVLPKHGADGKFIEDDNSNNKIPFPLEGPITNEYYTNENLKISTNNMLLDTNVVDDASGNNNYGFSFSDYRPNFDKQTLNPKKVKNTDLLKTSKNNGAF